MRTNILVLFIIFCNFGCMSVVNQGEVGVRDTLGAQSTSVSEPGFKLYLWPVWDITKVSVRPLTQKLDYPYHQKGLTIDSVFPCSIVSNQKVCLEFYRILSQLEKRFIYLRSAVADITAQYQ